MKYLKSILLTSIISVGSTVLSNPRTLQSFAHYQQKTREFLTNLGVNNANSVLVERLISTSNTTLGLTSSNVTTNGRGRVINSSTKIGLNERAFRTISEGMRLFVCAHEAAHYACNHNIQAAQQGNRAPIIQFEQEADEYAARMLCAHGYRWVVQEYCNNAYNFVRHGQGHIQPDHEHPSYATQYHYLTQILNGQNTGNIQPANTRANRTPQRPTRQTTTRIQPNNQRPVRPTYTAGGGPSGYRNPQNAQRTPPTNTTKKTNDYDINIKEYFYPFAIGVALYTGYHIYQSIHTARA